MTRSASNKPKSAGHKLLGIADLLELAVPEIREIGRGLAQKRITRTPKTRKVKP